MPLYRKVLVRGLVRKLSKIFVSETKRSARKHPEGALGIYTTEPDHARNHQKNTQKSKTIDMAIHDKTVFFLFVIAGTPRRLRLKEPSLLTWIANLSRGYPLLHCFGLHAVH